MPIVGLKVILVGLGMFILALAVGDAVAQCAPGLISRGNSCCKPADCKINQDYILCDKNGEDKCEPCYTGTVNPKPFNTAVIPDKNFPKYCQKPECGDSVCYPEAEVANPTECLRTGKAVCQCSLSKEYCGSDPQSCQSSKEYDIPKGYQLMQNCSIQMCEDGYFKDKSGPGKCLKFKECPSGYKIIFNGSIVKDRQCEPPTSPTTNASTAVKSDIGSRLLVGVLAFVVFCHVM